MSKVRIVCKAPPSSHPMCGQLASYFDTKVIAIGEDGKEVELTNIESVTWTVRGPKAGEDDGEIARAVVTFVHAEVDVEGVQVEEPAP